MDPLALHARALAHLRNVAVAVPDDRWDTVTNCPPWTAAALLNHALASQLLWVGAVHGTERVPLTAVTDPQPLVEDRLVTVDEVIAEATGTWATEGVLERQITGPFGTLPGRDTIRFSTTDAMCHAWDLAVSTGLDPEVPDDLLAEADGLVDATVNDAARRFGLFADEPELPDDATATDRVMARTGRRRP